MPEGFENFENSETSRDEPGGPQARERRQHAVDGQSSLHSHTLDAAVAGAVWLSDQSFIGSSSGGGHTISPSYVANVAVVATTSSATLDAIPVLGASRQDTIGDLLKSLPSNYDAATQVQMLSATWAASANSAAKTPSTPKPFISILHHILSSSDYSDCMVWNDRGTCFIVCHNDRLAQEVLPTYFQHTNISSFTRQLNVYGFRRLLPTEMHELLELSSGSSLANYSGWTHEKFLRDDTSQLAIMTPRPSRARQLKREAKEAASAQKRSAAHKLLRQQQQGQGSSSTSSSSGSGL